MTGDLSFFGRPERAMYNFNNYPKNELPKAKITVHLCRKLLIEQKLNWALINKIANKNVIHVTFSFFNL